MVHTLPPWTSKWRMATIFGQIDQGELAARLGSIDTFDRRGNIVWMDDFEGPVLKWDDSDNATSGTSTISALYPYSKSQCLNLRTIASTSSVAYIKRTFQYPANINIGLEFHFTAPTNDATLYTFIKVYTGALIYEFGTWYDTPTGKLYIYSLGGEYDVLVDTLSLKIDYYTYNSMKLILDLTQLAYRQLILNNHSYTLTTEYAGSAADSTDPYIEMQIFLAGAVTGISNCYIDNFIFTQNEE